MIGPSLLFVPSFSAIFILLGLGATAVGSTLNDHRATLEKVSAALIVAMGVFFLAAPFVTRLNREFHVGGLMQRAGKGGPVIAGAAFAIAWTPCIGPTLGAILSAAALSSSAAHGALWIPPTESASRSPSRRGWCPSSRPACCRSCRATSRPSPASLPAEARTEGGARVLAPSLLFVLSFSTIFILLGLGATAVGSTLQRPQRACSRRSRRR